MSVVASSPGVSYGFKKRTKLYSFSPLNAALFCLNVMYYFGSPLSKPHLHACSASEPLLPSSLDMPLAVHVFVAYVVTVVVRIVDVPIDSQCPYQVGACPIELVLTRLIVDNLLLLHG